MSGSQAGFCREGLGQLGTCRRSRSGSRGGTFSSHGVSELKGSSRLHGRNSSSLRPRRGGLGQRRQLGTSLHHSPQPGPSTLCAGVVRH